MPIITFRDRRGNLVYHCGDGYAYFEATQHDHTKFLRCTQRAHWGCTGSATAEVNGDAGSVWRNKSAHTCTQDPLYPAVCTLKNYIIQEAKTRIDETPQQIYHRACAMFRPEIAARVSLSQMMSEMKKHFNSLKPMEEMQAGENLL